MAGGSAPTACEKIGSPKPQLTRTQGTQGVILYTVFLAGGIASGKSSVARELERRGAWRIDLDQVSRAVLEPGNDCLPEIADAFGDDLLAWTVVIVVLSVGLEALLGRLLDWAQTRWEARP